ncbi:hypothetical protein [Daejeonella sp.]|uniref:hypothetical protein n=1 Tax=Daejeonella sp. TaxID=2805397 RepID=UPI0030BA9259
MARIIFPPFKRLGMLMLAALVYVLLMEDVSAQQKKGDVTFGQIALAESRIPIRPGIPGKTPFWNIASQNFIYAPAFNYKTLTSAAKYKFELTSETTGTKLQFESKNPYAPLSPVWAELPVGYFQIKVSGISDRGETVGSAGEGRYYRAAPFNGIYHQPVLPYDKSAMVALEKLLHKDYIEYWLTHKVPDPGYSKYRYPSKIYSAVIIGALTYGKLKPEEQSRSLKLARTIADFMISISMPEGSPYQYFPPSYYGYEDVFKKTNSKITTSSIMTIIPADAGNAYLNLYDVTKDKKYLEAAKRIGETYVKTQMNDGSWYLFVDKNSGKPTASNIAIPTSTINYFDRLRTYGVTGLKGATENALKWIMDNPVKTFDWHGQFEDIYERPAYNNLSREQACDMAIYLLRNSKGKPKNVILAEELIRFAEDQFVIWEKPRPDLIIPDALTELGDDIHTRKEAIGNKGTGALSQNWITPSVQEQYVYWMPVGRATGIMLNTYWEVYKVTKKEIYLAKAKSIANSFTMVQKEHDGEYPTYFTKYKMGYWLNSTVYPATYMMKFQENLKKINK